MARQQSGGEQLKGKRPDAHSSTTTDELQGWGKPTNSELHKFAGDTLKLFFFVKTGENSDKFQMISKHIRGSDIQEADKIGIR